MTSHSHFLIPSHQSLIPAFKLLAAALPLICMGAKRLSFLAFPVWERQRYENNAVLDTKPSPRGEGGERSEPDRVLAV